MYQQFTIGCNEVTESTRHVQKVQDTCNYAGNKCHSCRKMCVASFPSLMDFLFRMLWSVGNCCCMFCGICSKDYAYSSLICIKQMLSVRNPAILDRSSVLEALVRGAMQVMLNDLQFSFRINLFLKSIWQLICELVYNWAFKNQFNVQLYPSLMGLLTWGFNVSM